MSPSLRRSFLFTLPAIAGFVLLTGRAFPSPAKPASPPTPQTIEELQRELTRILHESKTPGLSVALATKEQAIFSGGFGLANVAEKTPATGDTLFRIGSTSKAFTALAALKLQAEGRLDLNATLMSLAPEIQFQNPWERTDPVRIIHLLTHTTGFDDIHVRDYANRDPRPNNLREALAYDPDSRISRWRPGTRFSYCNAGPPIVAYVIEKITGTTFEDYVRREFFVPIGMATATYFPPTAGVPAASLYQGDGLTPFDYWHISMRPAGAINASAKDMAAYLRFYLNRGQLGGVEITRPSDIDLMERPGPTSATRAGLPTGYGLYNYTIFDEAGRVWHGHNGGMQGGLCDMMYLPEAGIGCVVMINSSDGGLLWRASQLCRQYLTRNLPKPSMPADVKIPDDVAARYAGWYVSVSPRVQLMAAVGRIANVTNLKIDGGAATLVRPMGKRTRLFAVTPTLLRRGNQSAATVVLFPPTSEDEASLVDGTTSFRREPAVVALAPLAIVIVATLLGVSTLLFLPVWVLRGLFGKIRWKEHLDLRLWPLAATGAVAWLVIAAMRAPRDNRLFQHYGSVTLQSLNLTAASVAPLLVAAAGLWFVLHSGRRAANRVLYAHTLLVLVAVGGMMICLAWLGAIPLVTWT